MVVLAVLVVLVVLVFSSIFLLRGRLQMAMSMHLRSQFTEIVNGKRSGSKVNRLSLILHVPVHIDW